MNTIEIEKKDDDSYILREGGKATSDLSRAGVWAVIRSMLLRCPKKGCAVVTVDVADPKVEVRQGASNIQLLPIEGPTNIPGGCGW